MGEFQTWSIPCMDKLRLSKSQGCSTTWAELVAHCKSVPLPGCVGGVSIMYAVKISGFSATLMLGSLTDADDLKSQDWVWCSFCELEVAFVDWRVQAKHFCYSSKIAELLLAL
ncbi:hypothetical protein Tco_0363212 [Tanacetum coccineum]